MNKDSYCSLEMSKKLHEVGIELETDCVWVDDFVLDKQEWHLLTQQVYGNNSFHYDHECFPAPSMSELWREIGFSLIGVQGEYEFSCSCQNSEIYSSVNPADALAELLIWVRGRDERTR